MVNHLPSMQFSRETYGPMSHISQKVGATNVRTVRARIVPGPATEVCGIKRGRYKSHHEPYNVISLPCFPVQRIGGLEPQIIPATE